MNHTLLNYNCKYSSHINTYRTLLFLDLNSNSHVLINYYSNIINLSNFNSIVKTILGKKCFKTDYYINKKILNLRKYNDINLLKFKKTKLKNISYYIIAYDINCTKCNDIDCNNQICIKTNKRFDMNYNRRVNNIESNILSDLSKLFIYDIYYIHPSIDAVYSCIGLIHNLDNNKLNLLFISYYDIYNNNLNFNFNTICSNDLLIPLDSYCIINNNLYIYNKAHNHLAYDICNSVFIKLSNSTNIIMYGGILELNYLNYSDRNNKFCNLIKELNQFIEFNNNTYLKHIFKDDNLYKYLLIIEAILYFTKTPIKGVYNMPFLSNQLILIKDIKKNNSSKKNNYLKKNNSPKKVTNKYKEKIKMNPKEFIKLQIYCRMKLIDVGFYK